MNSILVPETKVIAAPVSSRKQVSTVDNQPAPDTDVPVEQQLERTVQIVKQLQVVSPPEIAKLEAAIDAMPVAGDEFQGFQLLSELGRGAFGRVFLAQQKELADRPVALKIAPEVARESDRLARLQHTNIVPIHSVYLRGPLQAVCMPFLGSNTLRDVIEEFRQYRLGKHGKYPLLQQHFWAKGLSECEAILTLALRIAEGLAHAHERHILHCDLKPTNILFSDDGQPMLLDFNLAQHTLQTATATVGGTFPYMAPEHLRSLVDKDVTLDARADLYSLGVILCELATGTAPFKNYPSVTMRDRVSQMVRDRRQELPAIQTHNKAITPAIQAMIHKLLAPSLADRYPSAQAFADDLQRQLRHQPLKHAPDRSWKERWRKYRCRHPRLTSNVSLGLFALTAVGALSAVVWERTQRLGVHEARQHAQRVENDRREVEFLLTGLTGSQRVERSIALADAAQQRFPKPMLNRLAPAEQQHAKADLAEVLYLNAYGHCLKAKMSAGDERAKELALALAKVREGYDLTATTSRAVLLLEAEIARLYGHQADSQRLQAEAEARPAETGRDLHLLGIAAFQQGDLKQAIRHLEEALRRDPQLFNAWFLLGVARDARGEAHEALGPFSTCIALQPDFYSSYFNRGLAYLNQQRLPEARHDFDTCIRLKPDFMEAYLNRALTYHDDADLEHAETDLTKALELAAKNSRLHLMRAKVRQRRGDLEGATADRTQGLALTPVEPVEWVTRGLAQLPDDPEAALADYNEALKRDPRYLPALQNKGALLIRAFKKIDASIAVLTETIKHHPDDCRPRAGRGVLLARQGKRQQAIDDAEVALTLSQDPANLYQVAGIYALTSKVYPEDATEAFRLLGAALRQGFGFDLLDIDNDLDPIRQHPRFDRTIRQARDRRPTTDD